MSWMHKSHDFNDAFLSQISSRKVTENGTLYEGYIMFQMAQNDTEYWDLKIDYTINELTIL